MQFESNLMFNAAGGNVDFGELELIDEDDDGEAGDP